MKRKSLVYQISLLLKEYSDKGNGEDIISENNYKLTTYISGRIVLLDPTERTVFSYYVPKHETFLGTVIYEDRRSIRKAIRSLREIIKNILILNLIY